MILIQKIAVFLALDNLTQKASLIYAKKEKKYLAYFDLIIETLIKEKENEYNALIDKLKKYIFFDKKSKNKKQDNLLFELPNYIDPILKNTDKEYLLEKEAIKSLLFGYVVFYKINSIILDKKILDQNPISKILNEILILYIKD